MRSPVERPEVTTTRSPTGSPSRTHRKVTRWSLPTTNTPVSPPRSATAAAGTETALPLLPWSPTEGSRRSEEHTSELQSLMRISYAVFCLKKKRRNSEWHHDDKKVQKEQASHRFIHE